MIEFNKLIPAIKRIAFFEHESYYRLVIEYKSRLAGESIFDYSKLEKGKMQIVIVVSQLDDSNESTDETTSITITFPWNENVDVRRGLYWGDVAIDNWIFLKQEPARSPHLEIYDYRVHQ